MEGTVQRWLHSFLFTCFFLLGTFSEPGLSLGIGSVPRGGAGWAASRERMERRGTGEESDPGGLDWAQREVWPCRRRTGKGEASLEPGTGRKAGR